MRPRRTIRRAAITLALSALLLASSPGTAHAASSEKGLSITPIRQFLSVDAGKTIQNRYTVANLTGSPLEVTLSAKQFSVTDYAYNYTFSQPTDNWLHLGLAHINLQPGQSADIPFSLEVPKGSQPGGHYYTLFASATVSTKGVNSTIQAADLLYLTVNGQLIRTSHLQSSSIHWLSFGRSIPFSIEPVNTGNIYFFANVSGQLHGLFVRQSATTDTHLLMPGKPRFVAGSIPSPVLPGIYKATYGYKTDQGQSVTASHWVVCIPPWFIALLLATLLIAGKVFTRKQKPAETQ